MKTTTLAVAALLTLGLVACSGGAGAGPDDAAMKFFTAINDGDCDTAAQHIHGEEDLFVEMCPSLTEQFDDTAFDVEVDDVAAAGDTATVTLTIDGTSDDVNMVKVDDAWKIDLDNPF